MQTVLFCNKVVGSISKFEIERVAEITYWIDRKWWGKGIGSTSLKKFLSIEDTRPLMARVAFDNVGSQRILEKCGFVKTGIDKGFANARQSEVEEYIYRLNG